MLRALLVLGIGCTLLFGWIGCSDDGGNGDSGDSGVDGPTALSVTCSASPEAGAAPMAVSFTASVASPPAACSYAWDFGDGKSDTAQNPQHTYAVGDFTAKVTATCGAISGGCERPIKVVTDPLVVTCDAGTNTGTPPLAVSFTSTASGGLGGYTYAWDFGDGESATTQDAQHTYKRVGKFAAVLTVASDVLKQTCTADVEVHIDEQVTVPAGGGKAQTTFDAVTGQTLRITLTATNTSLVPFGYLEHPDGTGTYLPDEANAKDGKNTGQATLTQDGTHTQFIFDSGNTGGEVQVLIEEI